MAIKLRGAGALSKPVRRERRLRAAAPRTSRPCGAGGCTTRQTRCLACAMRFACAAPGEKGAARPCVKRVHLRRRHAPPRRERPCGAGAAARRRHLAAQLGPLRRRAGAGFRGLRGAGDASSARACPGSRRAALQPLAALQVHAALQPPRTHRSEARLSERPRDGASRGGGGGAGQRESRAVRHGAPPSASDKHHGLGSKRMCRCALLAPRFSA